MLTCYCFLFTHRSWCSILYKTKLPFVLVFNKTDITSHEFAQRWMQDFEEFDRALALEESFMSDLTRSMSLMLSEFYENLKVRSIHCDRCWVRGWVVLVMNGLFVTMNSMNSHWPLSHRQLEYQQSQGRGLKSCLSRLKKQRKNIRVCMFQSWWRKLKMPPRRSRRDSRSNWPSSEETWKPLKEEK